MRSVAAVVVPMNAQIDLVTRDEWCWDDVVEIVVGAAEEGVRLAGSTTGMLPAPRCTVWPATFAPLEPLATT